MSYQLSFPIKELPARDAELAGDGGHGVRVVAKPIYSASHIDRVYILFGSESRNIDPI